MHFLILKEMYPRLTLFRMCISSVPAGGIWLVLQSTKSIWPYGYKQTPRRVCAPMFMCGAASDLGKEGETLLSSQADHAEVFPDSPVCSRGWCTRGWWNSLEPTYSMWEMKVASFILLVILQTRVKTLA